MIPCYNEADRLKKEELTKLLTPRDVHLVLVNDGSTDSTQQMLDEYRQAFPGRIEVVHLHVNQGKAEAVRQGLLHAFKLNPDIVGYYDADFATPAHEMLRLLEVMRQQKPIRVLLASRWLHLGARIDRKALRHYGGRIFATLASQVLGLSVYDTQCGAKLFRLSESLQSAVATPFSSRWAFDVELLGRLLSGGISEGEILEVPLDEWKDVRGSKIGMLDMIRATLELLVIKRRLPK